MVKVSFFLLKMVKASMKLRLDVVVPGLGIIDFGLKPPDIQKKKKKKKKYIDLLLCVFVCVLIELVL